MDISVSLSAHWSRSPDFNQPKMGQHKQSLLLVFWQLVVIILFIIFVDYEPTYNAASNEGAWIFKKMDIIKLFFRTNVVCFCFLLGKLGASNRVSNYYVFYSHVATMALVGFGYLMTFVRRYRFGAVGYTFLVTVLVRLSTQLYSLFVNFQSNMRMFLVLRIFIGKFLFWRGFTSAEPFSAHTHALL
jgi:hypothetical protein